MDIAALKWSITEQLARITDSKVLEQIQRFIAGKVKDGDEPSDKLTEAEIEAFDRQHAAYLSGGLQGLSGKESVQRLRKAQAKHGAL